VVSHWSDREIARQCRVGAPLIGRLREEIRPATVTNYSEPKTFTTKYGTVAKMNTAAKLLHEVIISSERPPVHAGGFFFYLGTDPKSGWSRAENLRLI